MFQYQSGELLTLATKNTSSVQEDEEEVGLDHGQGLPCTENLSCAQKMATQKCTGLMFLIVVRGTALGICVFAQTHTKLKGALVGTSA